MGQGSLVEPTQHHPVKICFSKNLKVMSTLPYDASPSLELDGSGQSRDRGRKSSREMFFTRVGGFPEAGVKWIVDNVKKMADNFGSAIHGRVAQVSFPRTRRSRQLCFARVADALDADTKETLYEVKEDVEETAQKARVPVPSARLPFIGFIHSLTVKDLICGVLAGAVAAYIAVPFDIVRTRVIAGQGGRTAAQVVSTVAHEEGLQTLLKGDMKFNIVKTSIEKGLQFATFEFVKRTQEAQVGTQRRVLPLPKQIPVATAGGAAAGLVGTLLGYPLAPVFDRIILQPDKYKSLDGTLKQVLRNEGGVRELYRGLTPALLAIVPTAAVSFYTYDTLKKKYLSNNSSPVLKAVKTLIIGGLAGAVSTTVTYPLEEARKQILLSAIPSNAVHLAGGSSVQYSNTWQALTGIVKNEGWHGLYRGLTVQTLQIVPVTAVTFLVFELAKRAFVASGEERQDEVKDVEDVDD